MGLNLRSINAGSGFKVIPHQQAGPVPQQLRQDFLLFLFWLCQGRSVCQFVQQLVDNILGGMDFLEVEPENVLRDLGLTLDRSNETYAAILDRLCGNPLAIRSILLRLQHCSARQLLTDLKSSFEGMEGDESTRRLKAAYAVFGSSLTERYLPVLQVTGLHDFHVDADYVKAMLNSCA